MRLGRLAAGYLLGAIATLEVLVLSVGLLRAARMLEEQRDAAAFLRGMRAMHR